VRENGESGVCERGESGARESGESGITEADDEEPRRRGEANEENECLPA